MNTEIDITPVVSAGFNYKSLKTWDGREGPAFQANLFFGTIKVAVVTEDGSGGEIRIDWIGVNHVGDARPKAMGPALEGRKLSAWRRSQKAALLARAKLFELADATPDVDTSEGRRDPLSVDAEWLLDELCSFTLLAKDCRGKTCFREEGDEEGVYQTINERFSAEMKTYIEKNHPGAVIINEAVNAILAA